MPRCWPAAGVQVIANDHLRGFSEDPWLVAQVAAVHALGDVWAMGAAPQAMLASVILPRLSRRLQARWLAEIMTAAAGVAKAAGAEIVGGHTSLGAELTIGFTVTGLATAPSARPARGPATRWC
jgi:selenide, water dikinase